jgi:DNA-binding transcriptional regulator YiaG
MKRKTNFDRYLEKQLKDPDFASRYQKAGEAWNVALQLAALRKKAGLSQKELAQRVGTSQQQFNSQVLNDAAKKWLHLKSQERELFPDL